MERKSLIKLENYFEVFLLIFLLLVFLLLIKSFLLPLLFASTMVFLSYKFYKFVCIILRNKSLSAFFVVIFVLFIILFPLYLISLSLISQTTQVVSSGVNIIGSIDFDNCEYNFCPIIKNNLAFIDVKAEAMLTKFGNYLSNSFFQIFGSISKFFIDLLIFLLAFFFLLRDGDKFVVYLKRITPMNPEYKEALFIRFRDINLAVFMDILLISILQGILVGFGFWMVGIESYIFWGFIAALFAIIPFLGPSLIWGGGVLYLALITNNYMFAVGLLAYSIVLISFSESIYRALIFKALLNKNVTVHPLLILLGILGGIEVFGFFLGLFIGPMIVSLLVSVLQLYKLDFT